MSFVEQSNPYRSAGFDVAARAEASQRAAFIVRTYLHLAAAVAAFCLIEAALLAMPGTPELINAMIGGRYSWLIVLALFMGVSWLANMWAMSGQSLGMQYLGLGLYVVAQAVVFLPLLYIAGSLDPNVIPTAGLITLILFAGLTATVFITRQDFSFLRSILVFSGFAALGFIVCSILIGFSLGMIFTVAMIGFACAYILYDTSNILLHYRTDQHVAASLALFASVALLFWYVLQLVSSRR